MRIANQIAPARPKGAAEVSIRELVTGAEDRLRETGLGIEICGELPTANNLIQNAPPVQQRFAGSKRQLVGHGDIQDLRDIISCNRTISLPVVRVTERAAEASLPTQFSSPPTDISAARRPVNRIHEHGSRLAGQGVVDLLRNRVGHDEVESMRVALLKPHQARIVIGNADRRSDDGHLVELRIRPVRLRLMGRTQQLRRDLIQRQIGIRQLARQVADAGRWKCRTSYQPQGTHDHFRRALQFGKTGVFEEVSMKQHSQGRADRRDQGRRRVRGQAGPGLDAAGGHPAAAAGHLLLRA